MRGFILCFVLLAAACTQTEPERCDIEATHDLAFSNAAVNDQISARAEGPSCDKAIGIYVIRDAEGFPLWSWSAPLSHRFGTVFEAEGHEHMQGFLQQWVQASLTTTQSAPAYTELTPGQSSLDQLTYDDIRARDLPMLCHFSGTARQTCVFWEPAAGGAGHFLDRDVVEEFSQ
jgi:hypothetical protein